MNLTIGQVDALRHMLADQFADDERGWLDALEGETDAFTLIRRLLDAIEAEEGTRTALTEQMDARKVRRDRCDVRIAHQRDAIVAVMRAAALEKLPLPEATLTLRETPEKLAVNDAAAVPDQYQVATFKPSMDAIKADFSPDSPALPNWLRVEPSRPSLTVRRK
ncbi:MAG: siphovirus Gp157 family protein [Janthinobacterium lividum]